ncbi:MAG: type 2 isopentenyl-diphosphate Delta-isomerase [Beijerinckiaceae bacterium]
MVAKDGKSSQDVRAVDLPLRNSIVARKDEHLDIVLQGLGRQDEVTTGFEKIRFSHCALPELALDEIDLSTNFLGKKLAAPLLISSMTGGPSRAERINTHLAEAAERLGIAFAVGSQRIAIESAGDAGLGRRLRQLAPTIPIYANFGAVQLAHGYGEKEAQAAVDMVAADALYLHLNPLQEALQPEGDRSWRGILERITRLARSLPVPIIAKEIGCGISGSIARRLIDAGVAAIDVAGASGTSWALVESERALSERDRAVARSFASWGIPTADAIRDVRAHCADAPLIGSGGIKDGITAAKALRIGADLAGIAAGTLEPALLSAEAVADHLNGVIDQLRIVCFCTGSGDLAALRNAALLDLR